MSRRSNQGTWSRLSFVVAATAGAASLIAAFAAAAPTMQADLQSAERPPSELAAAGDPHPQPVTESRQEQIERGRHLVIEHDCGSCHGGAITPDLEGWMVGKTSNRPDLDFRIGPCAFEAGAQPCFRTRPRNLTPDNLTGIGRFSERQIFNSLRFGLRPGETPDVEITSTTPGRGNFPMSPKYLAPPMPWPSWRHMPDEDLWAIAAYLKNAVKPVSNKVEDSEGPPDFWASAYTVEAIGPWPAAAFPTANEVAPAQAADLQRVRRGREMVQQHACSECHGGLDNPAAPNYLAGVTDPAQVLPFGECAIEPGKQPCFMLNPRNITPDDETGIGKYSERQIFNALRHGLRPSSTPDVEITSSTPGTGNFPAKPDYMAPFMPWTAWRHMPDEDIRAIAAYLKRGLKPVSNKVQDSDAPPEGWASTYTPDVTGSYPAAPFPTSREVKR
jgi:mono/diheme cytochrome c family protein